MIRHLEVLQRQHITLYVGLQELDALLAEWRTSRAPEVAADAERLIAAALPDLGARLDYLQVLHGLLREGVNVGDQAAILGAFTDTRGHPERVRSCIEAARTALREVLPGNREAKRVFRCSAGFESAVEAGCVERGRTRVLALTPAATNELITAIRDLGSGQRQPELAIATHTPGLRPFLRYLVEAEFPLVHVMDERELGPSLRERTDGILRLESEP
jgi:flagellar biosynthesis component FlhA